MKDTLNHLFAYRTLPQDEAHRVVLGIAQGQYNPAQIAAFLTVYLMRSVTVEDHLTIIHKNRSWIHCFKKKTSHYRSKELASSKVLYLTTHELLLSFWYHGLSK